MILELIARFFSQIVPLFYFFAFLWLAIMAVLTAAAFALHWLWKALRRA